MSITGIKRSANAMGATDESNCNLNTYIHTYIHTSELLIVEVRVGITLGQCSEEVRLAVEKCRQSLVHILGQGEIYICQQQY